MTDTNQKLREALQKAKDALSLALSDVDWRKDSPTQPVIHKAYNCAHQALALPTAEQVDDINVAESFTYVTNTAAPAQGEPLGYFRADPIGWTDCPEDAEGAIALYEHPAKPAQEAGLTDHISLLEEVASSLEDYKNDAPWGSWDRERLERLYAIIAALRAKGGK